MIIIKIIRIFGPDAAQTRAGNDARARTQRVIPGQRRIGDGVSRSDDAKLGEAIEPGKLGKMFSGFEASDLGRIMKTKPRGINLRNGADARTAGAQGGFDSFDRIADA